ncbi:MAG: hypothetical protein V7678_11175 [Brevundimonas sp.]
MTLFGQTLDGQQLFGLISLLTLLAFWILVWRRERQTTRWFRRWATRRQADRQAREGGSDPSDSHGGPWG